MSLKLRHVVHSYRSFLSGSGTTDAASESNALAGGFTVEGGKYQIRGGLGGESVESLEEGG